MYKYKLIKRANPRKPDDPKKWYATPIAEVAQSVKDMTIGATENTTTAPIELEAAIELLTKYAAKQLVQGHSVRLGNLGTLRIAFNSEGVEDINDFNPNTMIKNPRLMFNPDKDFRAAVLNDLQFTNGGVLDEGVNYSSLADYRKAKGIPSDEETSGGSDDGEL